MIAVNTKYGTFYIEKYEEREEEDRIKLYDSLERYLDYFTIECIEETWETFDDFVKEITKKAQSFKHVDELLEWLGINSYTISENWTDLLEDMYGEECWYDLDTERWYIEGEYGDRIYITEKVILDNEYVNKIGNDYILVCD